ncbi:MAG TPA: LON peptidase substrate-binding domain-containing protein [Nitrospiria bacterium]|nr:LON peptidase substrate-binding domain-containing protein [Nitrospiria bacterium]
MEKQPLPKIISLFPLPTTVLFPETYLPLHIFEPRYRDMVQEALDGSRIIGMVLLKEGWEKDYYGRPLIHPLGCMGKIVQIQRLQDGRFNLVLSGMMKFRVAEEFSGKSYRKALVHPIPPEEEGSGPLTSGLRKELERVLEVYGRLQGWEEQIKAVIRLDLEDRKLVQVLSAELDLTPAEKQFLLESDSLDQHCRRLIDFIRFMAEKRRARKGADRRRSTD